MQKQKYSALFKLVVLSLLWVLLVGLTFNQILRTDLVDMNMLMQMMLVVLRLMPMMMRLMPMMMRILLLLMIMIFVVILLLMMILLFMLLMMILLMLSLIMIIIMIVMMIMMKIAAAMTTLSMIKHPVQCNVLSIKHCQVFVFVIFCLVYMSPSSLLLC